MRHVINLQMKLCMIMYSIHYYKKQLLMVQVNLMYIVYKKKKKEYTCTSFVYDSNFVAFSPSTHIAFFVEILIT